MKATDLLAVSLNRRDEVPNQELAAEIIKSRNKEWIKELVSNLQHKDKNIQSDSIKVLYEIGERGAGELIALYAKDFGQLLVSKNNRLVWGAMIALDTIATLNPGEVSGMLTAIVDAGDKGSVIAKDHCVGILAQLAYIREYTDLVFPLLTEQLKKCPAKQLPMYAEKSVNAINSKNKKQFIDLIQSRIPEMEKDSQRQRLHKVLKRINDR